MPKFIVNRLNLLLILMILFLTAAVEAGIGIDLPFAPITEGDPTIIRPIYGQAVQPDGKIVIGGNFALINSQIRRNFARLNADGSLDNSFTTGTGPNAQVEVIAIQPDGKMVIAGLFSEYNGIARNWIARVNSDGSLDSTFAPEFNSQILTIIIQSDGKILLGGNFTTINGTTIRRIARLNSDGTLDTSFDPGTGANSTVRAIELQPDGKILAGGDFFSFNSTGVRYFLRLNANGSIDSSFNLGTGAGNSVYSIKLQTDGKIVIGGTFDDYNGTTRNNFARLNADGVLDTSLASPFAQSTIITSVDLQTDGKIIVLGNFVSLSGQARNGIARLNDDGTVDTAYGGTGFDNNFASSVDLLPDGKLLTSGGFTGYSGNPAISIARIDPNGLFDNTFQARTGSTSSIYAIDNQTDGKILIGGPFAIVNGVPGAGIARLNSDGTRDTSFDPGSGVAQGYVNEIAVQPDGKVVIAGRFTAFNGTPRNSIARLNTDGSLDLTFNTGVLDSPDSEFDDVLITSDGKILVSGLFRSFGGTQRICIAKLNADGSVDSSFASLLTSGRIIAIAIQPDGKIVIGGLFASYGGVARKDIARINPNGTLDTTFDPGTGTSTVFDIAIQPNGKIIIGGALFSYNGTPRTGVARVNADGSLDGTFDPGSGGSLVRTVSVDSRGRILAGGDFTQFNGVAAGKVVRLKSDGVLDPAFTIGTGSAGTVRAFGFQGNKILIGGFISAFDGILRGGLVRLTEPTAAFDYDGDGRSDLSIFRPANGEWWLNRSTAGTIVTTFGNGSDKIMPADFTGDGKTDVAFFRPQTGEWFILRSEDFSFYSFPFGTSGDIPTVGDFDGDGRADAAVFRSSTATWFINGSTDGVIIENFGLSGDIPAVGDYDGDGISDIAIFRPSNGQWWIKRSSAGVIATTFGTSTDKPVQSDFTGDGRTDVAFFRPASGEWFVLRSEDFSFYSFPFGASGDIAAPGDYDGDGLTDAGVFRPSSAIWYISTATQGTIIQTFGQTGDVPTPSAFVP